MVKLLSASAPAKINLFLRVVGRRPDGYHELDSIFIPVSLCDRIGLETRPASAFTVTLRCNLRSLPADDRNLAVRAASVFMAEFGLEAEVLIDLHKDIPVGAGLGGGSSDAGTVLRMMATLFRIDSPNRLAEIALNLGADVPFFLNPVPARVGGIGEQITPLDWKPDFSFLIAVPPIEVSTAEIFRALKPVNWSGVAPESDLRRIIAGEIAPALLVNDLAPAAISRWPRIGEALTMIQKSGALATSMTGSGSAVFGIFATAAKAQEAAAQLRRQDPELRIVAASPYPPWPSC
jgi:4-diphosphocytidyl-2-C-methyl-D-erythritol kinase